MIFASDKGRMCNNIFCHYPPCILSQLEEFKEVREVKAICFMAKYTTQKAIGYNF